MTGKPSESKDWADTRLSIAIISLDDAAREVVGDNNTQKEFLDKLQKIRADLVELVMQYCQKEETLWLARLCLSFPKPKRWKFLRSFLSSSKIRFWFRR